MATGQLCKFPSIRRFDPKDSLNNHYGRMMIIKINKKIIKKITKMLKMCYNINVVDETH